MGIRILGIDVSQKPGAGGGRAGTTRPRLWPRIVRVVVAVREGKVVFCVWQERDGEVWVRHRPRSVQCDGHRKKKPKKKSVNIIQWPVDRVMRHPPGCVMLT